MDINGRTKSIFEVLYQSKLFISWPLSTVLTVPWWWPKEIQDFVTFYWLIVSRSSIFLNKSKDSLNEFSKILPYIVFQFSTATLELLDLFNLPFRRKRIVLKSMILMPEGLTNRGRDIDKRTPVVRKPTTSSVAFLRFPKCR